MNAIDAQRHVKTSIGSPGHRAIPLVWIRLGHNGPLPGVKRDSGGPGGMPGMEQSLGVAPSEPWRHGLQMIRGPAAVAPNDPQDRRGTGKSLATLARAVRRRPGSTIPSPCGEDRASFAPVLTVSGAIGYTGYCGEVAEWSMAAVLKTVVRKHRGFESLPLRQEERMKPAEDGGLFACLASSVILERRRRKRRLCEGSH